MVSIPATLLPRGSGEPPVPPPPVIVATDEHRPFIEQRVLEEEEIRLMAAGAYAGLVSVKGNYKEDKDDGFLHMRPFPYLLAPGIDEVVVPVGLVSAQRNPGVRPEPLTIPLGFTIPKNRAVLIELRRTSRRPH